MGNKDESFYSHHNVRVKASVLSCYDYVLVRGRIVNLRCPSCRKTAVSKTRQQTDNDDTSGHHDRLSIPVETLLEATRCCSDIA